MTMQLLSDAPDSWNDQILQNPDGGTIFQSIEFAEQKARGGWIARYITDGTLSATVLEKSVPVLGKLWYLPKGPGVATAEQLAQFTKDIQPLARTAGVFAVKVEPELPKETLLDIAALRPTAPIQPNSSTVLVDISSNLDTVLASLNQKGRHAINRARRDGVTIERVDATDAHCRLFYDLLAETARGSFAIRPYEYYMAFWQTFAAQGMGQLFFAVYNGQLVAGAYALVFGAKSTYKDGASIRERTAYGASHLLQWEVMAWAKARGSQLHDLCGAPPSNRINDSTHPHYGIGRFKTSFNKTVTEYVGAYDIVIAPLRYNLWSTIGEKLVKRWWWQVHHESWY
ncbi:MAG: peptidoglycan bridge formation glycyltransferase FemA/FemB family protein [Candidatus Saccharimonadales bacterium]